MAKPSKTPWGDKAVEIVENYNKRGSRKGSLAAGLEGLIRDAQRAAVRDLEREMHHGIAVAANDFRSTLDRALDERVAQTLARINGGE